MQGNADPAAITDFCAAMDDFCAAMDELIDKFFLTPQQSPEPVVQREVITPGKGGIEIPVDKTKYRIRFRGASEGERESEEHVTIVVEPK